MTRRTLAAPKPRATVAVRALARDDGQWIEQLFGPRGACGGCWCMYWRVRGGKTWESSKGEPNRRAFLRLIERGGAHGAMAFAEGKPVGWCCIGPKLDFVRLANSRVLKSASDPSTWSVTCFYVPAEWRGRGVATALLKFAARQARALGASELEGYPVPAPKRTRAGGKPSAVPAAFAWTGVVAMFSAAGFERVRRAPGLRPIFRVRFH